jgi:hypothetical protein
MSKLFLLFSLLIFSGCLSEKSSQTEVRNLEKDDEQRAMRLKRKNLIDDIPQYQKLATESRFALIIGNNDYENFTTLSNAVNDATDIGKKLEKVGFKVFRVLNGNRDEMNRKMQQFSNLLKKSGGVGMVFYAGHGLEMGGTNYLVPVDSNVKDKFDIPDENVALNTLLARLDEAGNRLNIVVLDACRNDPVKDGDFRATFGKGGLANPPSASGTYIAYSADVGEYSEDGKGRNGTFTKHLLANLDKEIPLNKVFQNVRAEVEKETDGKQSPASYDKTTGDFYFKLPDGNFPKQVVQPEPIPTQEVEENVFTWSGKNFKFPELRREKSFQNAISQKHFSPQGEFESFEDFQKRKQTFYTNVLNSWLGEQKISMNYNPNEYLFTVHEQKFGFKFKFSVPFSEAESFKRNTKNFKFLFQKRNGKLFIIGAKSGNFSTNLNLDISEKIRETREKTLEVGNLMFQDFDLPEKMNWNSAISYCENLELVGLSDWRLPNKNELKIVRDNRYSFSNLRSNTSWYWSINKYNSSGSWIVHFYYGDDYWSYQTSNSFAVCVRDL